MRSIFQLIRKLKNHNTACPAYLQGKTPTASKNTPPNAGFPIAHFPTTRFPPPHPHTRSASILPIRILLITPYPDYRINQ